MSPRPCPACRAEDSEALSVEESMFLSGEVFEYLRCRVCSTLYIATVPQNLAEYYSPTRYYSFDVDPQQTFRNPVVRRAAASLGRSARRDGPLARLTERRVTSPKVQALMRKYRQGWMGGLPRGLDTSVLDVGAGSGVLVYLLHLAGLRQVLAIDPFIEQTLRFENGVHVVKAHLYEVDSRFDLVMLHHALEHVPDPGETLRQVRDRLNPGGRVVVRMPTVSSEAYETYGLSWFQLDAPRHLTIFSRQGVDLLSKETGFRVERVVEDGNASQFWASEQVRRRIPLGDPTSYFVNPRHSIFTRHQIRQWERRAEELNRAGRSDQAGWVLTPT